MEGWVGREKGEGREGREGRLRGEEVHVREDERGGVCRVRERGGRGGRVG